MQRSAVLCGSDASLLETRRMLLERAGIRVQTALGIGSLGELVGEVLILCYSLSKREQLRAVEQYRSSSPAGKVLIFNDELQNLLVPGCKVLDKYPGPQQFLDEVNRLLGQPPGNSGYSDRH